MSPSVELLPRASAGTSFEDDPPFGESPVGDSLGVEKAEPSLLSAALLSFALLFAATTRSTRWLGLPRPFGFGGTGLGATAAGAGAGAFAKLPPAFSGFCAVPHASITLL